MNAFLRHKNPFKRMNHSLQLTTLQTSQKKQQYLIADYLGQAKVQIQIGHRVGRDQYSRPPIIGEWICQISRTGREEWHAIHFCRNCTKYAICVSVAATQLWQSYAQLRFQCMANYRVKPNSPFVSRETTSNQGGCWAWLAGWPVSVQIKCCGMPRYLSTIHPPYRVVVVNEHVEHVGLALAKAWNSNPSS